MIDFVDTESEHLVLLRELAQRLPRNYQNIGVTIYIDPDSDVLAQMQIFHPNIYMQLINPNLGGMYIDYLNTIFIKSSRLYDVHENPLMGIIGVFLHELDHAYVAQYMPERYQEAYDNYISADDDPIAYQQQWIERRANQFMRETIDFLFEDEAS